MFLLTKEEEEEEKKEKKKERKRKREQAMSVAQRSHDAMPEKVARQKQVLETLICSAVNENAVSAVSKRSKKN